MRRTYADIGDTDTEVIKTLTAISKVSARMAGNLSLLANQRQSKEGGTFHEQNERNVTNHPPLVLPFFSDKIIKTRF